MHNIKEFLINAKNFAILKSQKFINWLTSKSTKENVKRFFTSKSFTKSSVTIYSFVIVLVLVVFVINAIGFSYSWFTPNSVNGDALLYADTVSMRNEDCSVNYYYTDHKESDGSIEYSYSFSQSVTISHGDTYYFKATIINRNEDIGPNVSLFVTNFPAASKIISLACTYPSNTYRTFTSNVDNLWIMRNAYVKPYNSSEANPGTVEVEWFIKNKSTSGDFTFNPNTLYLTYN